MATYGNFHFQLKCKKKFIKVFGGCNNNFNFVNILYKMLYIVNI